MDIDRALLFVTLLLPLLVHAQPRGSYYFPEGAEEKSWEELKLQLPPYPKDESLVKIEVNGATSFDFFVDVASVSVGGDGIIRYTLVARSSSGARNVSFEGIKCQGREAKLYAFGRSDGSWHEARDPRWRPILGLQANAQQAVLAENYFCPGRLIVKDAAEAIKSLQRGGHPRASKGGDAWSQPW